MRLKTVIAVLTLAPAASLASQAPSAKPPLAWHQTPATLASTCRATITEARAAIDAALAKPKAQWTFTKTMKPIEDALARLNTRTTPQTFMLYVSPDSAVRDSSNACTQAVSNVGVEISADPRIYQAALKAQSEATLTKVDKQLLLYYVETGRKSGAALDSATRARVTALSQKLNELERDYEVALAADSSNVVISTMDAESLPAQMRATLKSVTGGLRLPVNESTYGDVMRNEKNPDLRFRFMIAFNSRGGMANVGRLRDAVAIRDTIAHLSGFPTWAAYQLDTKMAKDPARVIKFLQDVDVPALAKAREEQAALAPFATRDGRPVPVQQADAAFYRNELRRTKYALDPEVVRQYFPVDQVVPAVLSIYSELFGVAFTETKTPDVWAPGVREFTVREGKTEKVLGTFYLDLFPRPNKYDHFASFPLSPARATATGRQLPVNAIVGNWPASAPGKPSLLTHDQVVTFFHEFGHCMAAMLDMSPFAGTGTQNLRQDFVEALSQSLENWMWQPSILKRVSRNVTTGEPLPDSLIQRMIALKHLADGYNYTGQAFYAMYDMTLHSSGASVDPVALWADLSPKMTVDPRCRPIPDSARQLRAPHGGVRRRLLRVSLVAGVRAGSVHTLREGRDPEPHDGAGVSRSHSRAGRYGGA